MAIELKEQAGGKTLIVHVQDKLTKEDYDHFLPEVERLIKQHGKINILFDMHDFHGWTLSAMWEDTKFAAHHFRDIERLAVVGEKKWQEWMTTFCRPFTTARTRYFEHGEMEEARQWLQEQ
ncbi:MAG TPA: STAS/SEC14 domain-containing protein [Pirellulaceae bacterium]|jgi:hypothetical protein